MNCKTCQYPLWNIRGRVCPECGDPFKPSDFEFVPSSVQFCCPGCAQPYYGTDEHGHLVPRSFACVKCGEPVEMDATVLLPTEGVDESRTQQEQLAWEQLGKKSLWYRFWATCGQAMIAPHRMGSILAQSGTPGRSSWFMLCVQSLAMVGSVGFLVVFVGFTMVLAAMGGGGGGGAIALGMIGVILASIFAAFVIVFVGVLLWTLATHAILMIGRKGNAGIGRTWTALCYSSGANIISAIPCIGGYFGPVWWMVSAVFCVRGAHGVGAWRAAIATLVPPVVSVLLFFGAYVLFFVAMLGGMGGAGFAGMNPPAMQWGTPAADMGTALDGWPGAPANTFGTANHSGLRGQNVLPDHALYLLVDGYVNEGDFVQGQPASSAVDADLLAERAGWTIGGMTIRDFSRLTPEEQLVLIDEQVEQWPENAVAHRVGDVVFPRGVPAQSDFQNPARDPMLWTAMYWAYTGPVQADGSRTESALDPTEIIVLKAGGGWMSESIAPEDFDAELAAQNVLRAARGLEPIPHPATVRDVATAQPGD